MSAPSHVRSRLAAVLFAALTVSLLSAASPPPAKPTTSAQPQPKDLGARTFVGEQGEFRVLLAWNPLDSRRVTLFTTRPGSVPVLMCAIDDRTLAALPNRVSCDHGRTFSLSSTKTGYDLALGKELVKELSFGREEPAPKVFALYSVNPFELTAPGETPYGVKRDGGNRSSETRHLRSPKPGRLPSAQEVSTWVRTLGYEPTAVPMGTAESVWRQLDAAVANGLLMELPEAERKARFVEILESALSDL